MNVLYIRKFTNLDGTHTLLVRMAKELREMGNNVYFLVFTGGEGLLTEEISQYATLIPEADLARPERLPSIDLIHGIIEGDLLWWAYWYLKNRIWKQARVVIGFYHPRVFWEPRYVIPSPDKLYYQRFFKRIPARNLLFMNELVRSTHEAYFRRKFDESPIIPLPVNVPEPRPVRTGVRKGKIVSIGRLVDFKNYVEYLIEVVAALRKQGYDLELHVYGDGLLRPRVEQKISLLGQEESVFLHGEVPYSELMQVLRDAHVFVGMGTSLIEAAGQGVPSLMAIESNQGTTTYGWFFLHEGYHVGEQVEGWPRYSMENDVKALMAMDDATYEDIARRCWEKSRIYSARQVMEAYVNFARNADASFTIRSSILQRWGLRITRQPFKLARRIYNLSTYGKD